MMDLQMPEMNGYDATREIKKFNTEVIIIAQTAFAMSDDRSKALEAGCDDYLAKPIRSKDLLDTVKKYLDEN
jgi:CheY-like chemotaxis protein